MIESKKTKPPYRVPTMAEVATTPWNGYRVASTFAGCGGSCTGYRMAGFKVVWANEFVPAAQDSYRANKAADCVLDCRDIKSVTPEEVLAATGLKPGDLDILDGSPPCQAFSTAGKREKGWGKAKRYEHGAEQCNETLFFEYVRLLRGLQPKVFVAENVKGLTIGAAKKMMGDHQLDMLDSQDDTILHKLMDCGYVVGWRVLNAADLGVPQTRNRVIFVGVRRDLADASGVRPCWPSPLGYGYTVKDALPWLGEATHECGGFSKTECINMPSPVVTVSQCRSTTQVIVGNDKFEPKWGDPAFGPCPTIMAGGPHGGSGEVRVVPLPPSRQKPGAYGVQDVKLDRPCPMVTCASPGNDLAVPVARTDPDTGASLELDASRKAVCDGTQLFGSAGGAASADEPAATVLTPSNSSVLRDERRTFTIAELRRICAFPDDFVLTGSYAQQWERLGNSVPPVMMFHIAKTVLDRILKVAAPDPDMSYKVPAPVCADALDKAAKSPPKKARKKAADVKAEVAKAAELEPAVKGAAEMDRKWVDYWKGGI